MIKRVAVVLVIIFILYVLNAFLFPFPAKKVPEGFKPSYGVSYSFEQAGWYGYDGRNKFVSFLEEVKVDWVRLSFFWDQMADENGEFNKNFEDLEFAIEEAGKRNVKVVIALGLKTPYYPEYHLPKKISERMTFGDKIGINHPVAVDVLTIDKKIVDRLAKHENISYWQIENEPYLANVNNWKIEKSLIEAEIKTVRDADRMKRPIILNHVGPAVFDHEWKDLAGLLETGDVFGVNAYFKTQGTNLFAFSVFDQEVRVPWPEMLTWPVQSWHFLSSDFSKMREDFSKDGIELWVLEMQAEPYVRNLEYARAGKFAFGAGDIEKADRFLKGHKVTGVGLWGANFWIYRENLGDRSWLDAVKSVVN